MVKQAFIFLIFNFYVFFVFILYNKNKVFIFKKAGKKLKKTLVMGGKKK
jgi:hypothetical protein